MGFPLEYGESRLPHAEPLLPPPGSYLHTEFPGYGSNSLKPAEIAVGDFLEEAGDALIHETFNTSPGVRLQNGFLPITYAEEFVFDLVEVDKKHRTIMSLAGDEVDKNGQFTAAGWVTMRRLSEELAGGDASLEVIRHVFRPPHSDTLINTQVQQQYRYSVPELYGWDTPTVYRHKRVAHRIGSMLAALIDSDEPYEDLVGPFNKALGLIPGAKIDQLSLRPDQIRALIPVTKETWLPPETADRL